FGYAIHQREIPLIGLPRVVVDERQLPITVWFLQTLHFREHHGLDHREAFRRPVIEVIPDLRRIEAVEQLPARVAQPEERAPVGMDERTAVGAHLPGVGALLAESGEYRQNSRRNNKE